MNKAPFGVSVGSLYLQGMKPRPSPLIVLTGPESSGKTTLATALSHHFGWPLVSEYARFWLENHPSYTETDICRMALGQHRWISECLATATTPVITDTDVLSHRIWLLERFGRCPGWLSDLQHRHKHTFYLLCYPDIPWEPDPQRENPFDRERLWEEHMHLLEEENRIFAEVRGEPTLRLKNALLAIEDHLQVSNQ